MTTKSLRKWVYLLLAVLLIAAYPIAVLAQQDTAEPEIDDDENAVFVGIVEEIGETSLIVSSVTFDTATADFGDDELEIGALVSVEFTIVEGDAVALRVALRGEDDDDDNTITAVLVGVLESLEGAVMIAAGLTFDVTFADIDDDVVVGAVVIVEFSTIDGELVAIEVDVYDDDDDNGDNDDDDDNGTCVIAQPAGWTFYTVRPGDTLSAIAAASGTDFSDLIEANCITNISVVVVGVILFVENEIIGDISDQGGDDDDNNGGDNDDNGGDDGDDNNGGDDDDGDDDGDDD